MVPDPRRERCVTMLPVPDHAHSASPPLLVVMGVSGSGKSTVGAALARRLDIPFVDGDDLHPPANRARMAAGIPLDDAARAPWLEALASLLARWRKDGGGGVVACSALKRSYRDIMNASGIRFVYLVEDSDTVAARLARRTGHFMPAELIGSQFATLEPPTSDEDAIIVPPAPTVALRTSDIIDRLACSLPSKART